MPPPPPPHNNSNKTRLSRPRPPSSARRRSAQCAWESPRRVWVRRDPTRGRWEQEQEEEEQEEARRGHLASFLAISSTPRARLASPSRRRPRRETTTTTPPSLPLSSAAAAEKTTAPLLLLLLPHLLRSARDRARLRVSSTTRATATEEEEEAPASARAGRERGAITRDGVPRRRSFRRSIRGPGPLHAASKGAAAARRCRGLASRAPSLDPGLLQEASRRRDSSSSRRGRCRSRRAFSTT